MWALRLKRIGIATLFGVAMVLAARFGMSLGDHLDCLTSSAYC